MNTVDPYNDEETMWLQMNISALLNEDVPLEVNNIPYSYSFYIRQDLFIFISEPYSVLRTDNQ